MANHYIDQIVFDAPSQNTRETLAVRDVEARALIQTNTNAIAEVTAKEAQDRVQIATNTQQIIEINEDIDRIDAKDAEQDNRLDAVEAKNTEQDNRLDAVEAKNTEQDGRLDTAEADIDALESRMDAVEAKNTEQDVRLDAVEAKNTEQDGRLDTAEADIDTLQIDVTQIQTDLQEIKDKDSEQDDRLDDLDDRVAASTYEAGIGIYFGQGVVHTNINVEDEILDQINMNSLNIEILTETKTELYTYDNNGNRINYPELLIDPTLQVTQNGDDKSLRAANFRLYMHYHEGDLSDLHITDEASEAARLNAYLSTHPFNTVGGHSIPIMLDLIRQRKSSSDTLYDMTVPAIINIRETSSRTGYICAVTTDEGFVSGALDPDVHAVMIYCSYNATAGTFGTPVVVPLVSKNDLTASTVTNETLSLGI